MRGKGSRDGKNWIDGWGEVEKMRRFGGKGRVECYRG